MIYCKERKLGIFMNPKTGSHTISKTFKNISVTKNTRDHSNYVMALDYAELPDFNTFKFYCFYRDPIDRFNSGFKFYKRYAYAHCLRTFFSSELMTESMKQISKAKYDKLLHMNKKYDEEYLWLSQDLKDKIESITVSQLLNHFTYEKINGNPTPEEVYKGAFQETPSPFINQRFWLDHDIDLTLLNFASFEEELKTLVSLFGVTLETVSQENRNLVVENEYVLTQEDISLIKQFYKPDYDFFASKGITFDI
jgi:hypothetical protein